MGTWTLESIPWHAFDASKVKPEFVSLAKAASMVEYNGQDYSRYLEEVFADDPEFKQAAREWAEEEVQHGAALRKWAEYADPQFDFDQSFKTFTEGYKLPVNVNASVRGSQSGELIARCVVETGTSMYYTAIKEATDEPVLKAICAKIAADEFRHYKLFYTHLKRYLKKENIGTLERFKVALSRIAESEDDELAYAFFAAHHPDLKRPYDHELFKNLYMSYAYSVYRKDHVERMIGMVFKAAGIKAHRLIERVCSTVAWGFMRLRTQKLARRRPMLRLSAAI